MRMAMTAAKIGRVMKKRDRRMNFLPARRRPFQLRSKASAAGESRFAAEGRGYAVRRRGNRLRDDLAGADLHLDSGHRHLRAADNDSVRGSEAGPHDAQAVDQRAEADLPRRGAAGPPHDAHELARLP